MKSTEYVAIDRPEPEIFKGGRVVLEEEMLTRRDRSSSTDAQTNWMHKLFVFVIE